MLDLALNYAPAVLSAVGGASVLAALLPRPSEGTPWAKVFAILDILAANFLAARNAPVAK